MSLNISAELAAAVREAIQEHWPNASGIACDISIPSASSHGDYATNAAMLLAAAVKESPKKIAETLQKTLSKDSRYRVEIAGPGFINFFLTDTFFSESLHPFLDTLSESNDRSEKIVLEHTNVNPNKAMHIGHLRNAVLGDVIKRVLDREGFITEVQYYVDDTGVQVADTYLGLRELDLHQETGEKFDHFCWRVYSAINQAYEQKPELLEKRKNILHEIEDRNSTTAHEVKELSRKILQEHLITMSAFDISYDLLVWESDILAFGFWEKAFEVLKTSDYFVKETEGKNKGCFVIKIDTEEEESPEHSPDKVIVKSDGTVTYTGKDIAYHLWKFNLLGKDFLYSQWHQVPQKEALFTTDTHGTSSTVFGHASRVFNVIDVRQAYPQAVIKLVFETLSYRKQAENLKHISYGVVSLSSAAAQSLGVDVGESASSHSMSGRKGIGIHVDSLLDTVTEKVAERPYQIESDREQQKISPRGVAVGALKYFMLRYNPDTSIVFDYNEALALEGNTGPYIQYAHARASGILAKGDYRKISGKVSLSLAPEERRLVAKLYEWPGVLSRVASTLAVNQITTYAFELANVFNSFYEAHPVLKSQGDERTQRLVLVASFRAVIADVLNILGIEAPDKM